MTRNASILEWQSYDYIGRSDIQIYNFSIGGRENVTSVSNPNIYAIQVSSSMEDGVTVIVSPAVHHSIREVSNIISDLPDVWTGTTGNNLL